MRPRSPGHLKTFDYRGLHRYFLTFCTHGRVARFVDADRVALVLSQVSRAAAKHQFALIVYCFMPDHLHLLAEGQTDDADCRKFIARAKHYAGFRYAQTYREVLWQRYGFEHVLRDDELTLTVARYILANPVRAGLVDNPQDYPFAGSQTYRMSDLLDAAFIKPSG